MRRTISSRTIASLGVGIVVAASIVAATAYVTRPSTSSVDDQLVASANQRTTVTVGASATDPGLLLEQWTPRPVPRHRVSNAVRVSTTQPPVIPLVQVAKPVVQAAAPSTTSAQPKPQVEAATNHDGGEDITSNSNGESQGSDE